MLSCLGAASRKPSSSSSGRRRSFESTSTRNLSEVTLSFKSDGVLARLQDPNVEMCCFLHDTFFFEYRFHSPPPRVPPNRLLEDVMDLDSQPARPLVERDKVVLQLNLRVLLTCLEMFQPRSGIGSRRRADGGAGGAAGETSGDVAVLQYPGEDGRLVVKLTSSDTTRTSMSLIGVARCEDDEFSDLGLNVVGSQQSALLREGDGDAADDSMQVDVDGEGAGLVAALTPGQVRKRTAGSLTERFDGWAEVGRVVILPPALLNMLNDALWIGDVVYIELNGQDDYLQFEARSKGGLFLQETLPKSSGGFKSFRCGNWVRRSQYSAELLTGVAGAVKTADKDCTEVTIRINQKSMLQFKCAFITDVELQFTMSPSVHVDEEGDDEIDMEAISDSSSGSDSDSDSSD